MHSIGLSAGILKRSRVLAMVVGRLSTQPLTLVWHYPTTQVSSTIGDDVEKQGIFNRHTMDDKVIVTQFSPGGCHPCVTAIVGIYAKHEWPSIFCPVRLEMEEDQRFANMMNGSGTGFFNLSWTRVESGSE
jgi:hypothetical protein